MSTAPLCVYCRKRPVDERVRPFCSERCKLLDLAAWADGQYRIPDDPIPDESGPRRDEDDEPVT